MKSTKTKTLWLNLAQHVDQCFPKYTAEKLALLIPICINFKKCSKFKYICEAACCIKLNKFSYPRIPSSHLYDNVA